MENFFNWISKPVKPEDIEVWFNVNNMIPEKGELFFDFCLSLFMLMKETYLGEEITPNETRIILSDDDKLKHFTWCWNKNIENFMTEGIAINCLKLYDYFLQYMLEVFYSSEKKPSDYVDTGSLKLWNDIFDYTKSKTNSEMDTFIEIYKLFEKSIKM